MLAAMPLLPCPASDSSRCYSQVSDAISARLESRTDGASPSVYVAAHQHAMRDAATAMPLMKAPSPA
jgi:hypothetical protein